MRNEEQGTRNGERGRMNEERGRSNTWCLLTPCIYMARHRSPVHACACLLVDVPVHGICCWRQAPGSPWNRLGGFMWQGAHSQPSFAHHNHTLHGTVGDQGPSFPARASPHTFPHAHSHMHSHSDLHSTTSTSGHCTHAAILHMHSHQQARMIPHCTHTQLEANAHMHTHSSTRARASVMDEPSYRHP